MKLKPVQMCQQMCVILLTLQTCSYKFLHNIKAVGQPQSLSSGLNIQLTLSQNVYLEQILLEMCYFYINTSSTVLQWEKN